jgi:NADPH-dependent glutamate synthase beta subunit-like oxidoreductase
VPKDSDNEVISIPCDLLLSSVGYKTLPLPNTSEQELPFDKATHTIPNVRGRVVDSYGSVVSKLYTSGWCKRGPYGIIGTNISDAKETVESVVEDLISVNAENYSEDHLNGKG